MRRFTLRRTAVFRSCSAEQLKCSALGFGFPVRGLVAWSLVPLIARSSHRLPMPASSSSSETPAREAAKIVVIDYGMGNLRSVEKGFARMGSQVHISADPREITTADKLVLPGVGAFRDAIAEVRRLGFDEPIKAHIAADKPFLGICLGLQLLFDISYEEGEYEGLGVIPGKCVKFEVPSEYKVPHMGWNQLRFRQRSPLFAGLPEQAHVYFVHSYYVAPDDPEVIAAESSYPKPFTAAICRGNLFATQFHPEKSQQHGLRILQNFAAL